MEEEDHHDDEEVVGWRHVCKFCRKRFQSGRSLGGHMRSHMVNDVSALTDGTLITRKKLPSLPENLNKNKNKKVHLGAPKSASLSVGSKNNGSCSGTSGIEVQEQEEVAMCLMLLSRDHVHVIDQSSGNCSSTAGLSTETESNSKRKRKLADDVVLESENNSSKFECHKKIKGCSSLNSTEEESHEVIMMKSMKNEILSNNKAITSKKKKKKKKKERVHECPICFKVFTSGQALGGHKRSHLSASIPAATNKDFLVDLNLPAPVDLNDAVFEKPWWTETKHEQEQPLVG
ncbi:Zinc finger protein ZAT9 [Linum grandiflorum]